MKILFLSRHLQNSTLIPELQRLGVACLVCSDPNEADLVLRIHGKTITLAVGHDQEGIQFVSKIKDIAKVITTSEWNEVQCAQHQKTADGANAYLRTPFEDRAFIKTLDLIFGTELSHGKTLHRSSPETRLTMAAPVTSDAEGIALDVSVSEASIESSQGQKIEAVSVSTAATTEVVAEAVSPVESLTADSGEFALQLTPPSEDLVETVEAVEVAAPVAESIAPTDSSLKIDIAPSEPAETDAEVPGYLEAGRRLSDVLSYTQPVGDAVIPGGASQTPDEETLKKYLLLREQDVATLSSQFKQSKNRIVELERELQELRSVNAELMHLSQEQEKRIESFDTEKQVSEESSQKEIDNLKFEIKKRGDKAKVLEVEVRKMAEETERLKERVKLDIRKIRTREKELENRLEILKKDSEVLIAGREQKIVDLKRKLDTAEFNLDLLQDKYEQEKQNSAQLREKLDRAAQAVRVAGGLLHPTDSSMEDISTEPTESATVKHAV